MHMRSVKLALVLLSVVCVGAAVPALAQSVTAGTVVGTVTDQSGAVVAGAAVTLTDISTNIARATTTNKEGRYVYVDVSPGVYNIAVSKVGFETTKALKQGVQVGATVNVNLSLQVGGANVVVEVQATGTELATTNATVGNTISGDLVNFLPSLGRDVNSFISLQPGVATDGSVAGAVMDQSYFSLDGGNNSNDMDGSGGVYVPNLTVGDPTGGVAGQNQALSGPSGTMPTPQDSVEEFKVNTTGQTADFNSSAGAEIKVVTKRGTNSFHGTAYEYYKDNKWSANSWQNEYDHVPLPDYHYSRFGGAIGGPLIPKDVLGGKTYFFFNYEGFKWPNVETYSRDTPSPALRLGLITDTSPANLGTVDYNLNNFAVTYNGTTYPANYGCGAAPGGLCDPRSLGLNPSVAQIWSTWMPQSNSTSCALALCDGANVLPFAANLALPTTSRFAVARVDHDFSAKQHFMTSYRYYHLNYATDDQVDIGGFFPGDTLGVPTSLSSKPTRPWYLVASLTSNITTNTTNDIHYSFLRNWWAYARTGDVPQLPGLGGALEIESGQSGGELETLAPYDVDNQNTRTRFWDGKDNMIRDDLSILKGNHLFQLGGMYQHNFNWHQRTDNGGTINNQPVYDLGYGTSGSLLSADAYPCGGVGNAGAATTVANCGALTAAALGIVSASEVAYTRSGASLALQPIGTPAYAKSTIPYYNVYFSDTWHMKPTFTLTYGLGWTLEMPPVEQNGQQVELVDQADQPLGALAYLAQRKAAALQGQVYNPEIGYALVGNTQNGLKYPYNPFYGEFAPRIAAAWNPRFDSESLMGRIFGHEDTVIRGGYGRVYGRLNGVDLVLVPLLAPGIIQPVQCVNNLMNGTCGASGTAAASNAFRVGATASGFDGLNAPIPVGSPTLPQPYYPGYNQVAAGPGASLDPNFRPNSSDAFDFTIQRQLNHKVSLEVGYIGRKISHEYQPVNINTVPYMMTLGGQQFSAAWRNVLLQYCGGLAGMGGGGCAGNAAAVTSQPFFEAALAGTGYCTPGNCTATVVAKEGGNLANDLMWNLWGDLDNGGFNFPRSMMNTPIAGSAFGSGGQTASGVAVNTSIGHGNYNAGFVSIKMADWKGLTLQSNLTWAKALGTGAEVQATSEFTTDDPFNLNEMYGRQPFDRKLTYNALFVYNPPFYKGQSRMIGRLLGGWTFSSVFAAGTGTPVEVFGSAGNGSPWGEGDNTNFFGDENAVPIGPIGGQGKAYYNSPSTGLPVNIFKNGVAEVNNWRNPVIGIDNRDGAEGMLNGLRYWNMDVSAAKNIRVAENVSMTLQGVFQNVFNHNQFLDPILSGLYSPSNFGALYNLTPFDTFNTPRNIQLGVRVSF